jgi:hypothetical protein
MSAVLAAAHQCLTKGGFVPCGTVGWVISWVFMMACGIVGVLYLLFQLRELVDWLRNRRRR